MILEVSLAYRLRWTARLFTGNSGILYEFSSQRHVEGIVTVSSGAHEGPSRNLSLTEAQNTLPANTMRHEVRGWAHIRPPWIIDRG